MWCLVLPYLDDLPPGLEESITLRSVPLAVAINLRVPVGRIGGRPGAVLRTPVPEAPINKHGYPLSRKDDICLTT
jgi:hypothetical protein